MTKRVVVDDAFFALTGEQEWERSGLYRYHVDQDKRQTQDKPIAVFPLDGHVIRFDREKKQWLDEGKAEGGSGAGAGAAAALGDGQTVPAGQYRGNWSPTETYQKHDVVFSKTTKSTFRSMRDQNLGVRPDAGDINSWSACADEEDDDEVEQKFEATSFAEIDKTKADPKLKELTAKLMEAKTAAENKAQAAGEPSPAAAAASALTKRQKKNRKKREQNDTRTDEQKEADQKKLQSALFADVRTNEQKAADKKANKQKLKQARMMKRLPGIGPSLLSTATAMSQKMSNKGGSASVEDVMSALPADKRKQIGDKKLNALAPAISKATKKIFPKAAASEGAGESEPAAPARSPLEQPQKLVRAPAAAAAAPAGK